MKHYLDLPDIAESLASGLAMEGVVIPPRATRELGGGIVEGRKNESMLASIRWENGLPIPWT